MIQKNLPPKLWICSKCHRLELRLKSGTPTCTGPQYAARMHPALKMALYRRDNG